jgi:hypothetical protein
MTLTNNSTHSGVLLAKTPATQKIIIVVINTHNNNSIHSYFDNTIMAPNKRQLQSNKRVSDDDRVGGSTGAGRFKKQTPPSALATGAEGMSNALPRPPEVVGIPSTMAVASLGASIPLMQSFNTISGISIAHKHNSRQHDSSALLEVVSKITEPHTSNEWLEDDGFAKIQDRVKMNLDAYIRGDFFDKCKFLTKKMLSNWSSDEDAICLKICKALNVKRHKYEEFWEEHALQINKSLNSRRNDVGGLLQKAFLGKPNRSS